MRTVIKAAIFLILSAATLSAQDWPQWRGPNRDGAVAGFSAPAALPDSLKLKWRIEVGVGHSSPVVAGKRIYLHSRQGEQEVVSAFALDTGKLLWKDAYGVEYKVDPAAAKHGKGPKSTPVIANGRLVTLGINGILSCYDAATGKVKWRSEFSKQFKKTSPDYGTAMSPVIDRRLVIAYLGGHNDGALIAFDLETGREKWRWKDDGPGYASPIVVELSGIRQVITLSQQNIIGVSAASGELLWKVPFKTEWDNSIMTPVAYKDAFIFSGDGKGTFAVKPSLRDGKWVVETIWHNDKIEMYMNTPVMKGYYLFGMSALRKGQFFCIDARTGATLWTSEGREGDNAAILVAGSLLLLLTEDAVMTLARATENKYEVLKKYTVAQSPTWAHPVILGNRLLIKDEATLTLWSLN